MIKIIHFFVLSNLCLQMFANTTDKYAEAYKILVEKFSCSNPAQCKKIEKNLTPEALREEFEQNEELIKFKKAILAKEQAALRTMAYVMEDRMWHAHELAFAGGIDSLIASAFAVPIIFLAIAANVSCATDSKKTFIASEAATAGVAAYIGKEYYSAYKNFQYMHKINQGDHEIKRIFRD